MMTLGYVLFSFFISLADGAYNDIINKFIKERTGHIQIHRLGYLETPRLNQTIKNYPEIISKLITTRNIPYSLRLIGGALAFSKNKSIGVEVIGVIPELESKLTTLKSRVNIGKYFPANHIIIGKRIAELLELNLGNQLILISQGADGSVANDIFHVGGIISSQDESFDDSVVYMPLEMAQDFFSLYNQIHEIALRTHQEPTILAQSLNQLLSKDLKANTWQEVEKDFYRAMQVDRKGDMIGQSIFIVVVVIGVLNTILMSILERNKEFGVLKAIGTRPITIFSLITLETFLMSIISVILGIICALFINGYFSIVGIDFTPFEYGGMRFDKMFTTLNVRCFVLPALTIIGSSIMVSIFPALKAARVFPIEEMRKI